MISFPGGLSPDLVHLNHRDSACSNAVKKKRPLARWAGGRHCPCRNIILRPAGNAFVSLHRTGRRSFCSPITSLPCLMVGPLVAGVAESGQRGNENFMCVMPGKP